MAYNQAVPTYSVPGSSDEILISEGILYFNYGEVSQVAVGASQGGGSFTREVEYRDVPVDGAIGAIKGLKRKIRINAMMIVNALKVDKDNFAKFYAGMTNTDNTTYYTTTEDIDVDDGDYLVNVTFVGQTLSGKYVKIYLLNPLGDGNTEFANLFNKEEIVPNVQLTAHFDPAAMTTVPWKIDWEV